MRDAINRIPVFVNKIKVQDYRRILWINKNQTKRYGFLLIMRLKSLLSFPIKTMSQPSWSSLVFLIKDMTTRAVTWFLLEKNKKE